jgi:hypothetical protein
VAGFTYDLATEADDAELRALLGRISMPGEIALTFRREPSFFAARSAGNVDAQTVVCRDEETGELLGFGERSFRRAFVDGERTEIGYLGMLRGVVERRGGLGIARGYRYFRDLHAEDQRVPFYVTTILEENAYAISVLARGRGGLPTYEQVGRLVTYLIPLRRGYRAGGSEAVRLQDEAELQVAVDALNAWNRGHQLAPVYDAQDLVGHSGLVPAFAWRDLFVVRDGDAVLGTLGVWDQRGLKQTVVAGYSRRMRLARPAYNGYAAARGLPALPPAGASIATVHGAFLSAAGDDPEIADALVAGAREAWGGRGISYLAVGVAEDHPLTPALSRHASRELKSLAYAVYWSDAAPPSFDRTRRIHLETATL